MREWFDLSDLENTYKQMGRKKVSHMELFKDSIIEKMTPYFEPLFSGFWLLRDTVFPPGKGYVNSPITHDAMKAIFNDILSGLPEEYRVAAEKPKKRKRHDRHTCEFLQYIYGLDPDVH
jgi:hypothetical protein